jgi:hypothetical protein
LVAWIGEPIAARTCAREQRRLDMGSELAQVVVAPRGRDAVVDARALTGAVPAHAEAIAVGRFSAHARMQALVHDAVLRLEEQLVHENRLAQPPHPATHHTAPCQLSQGLSPRGPPRRIIQKG